MKNHQYNNMDEEKKQTIEIIQMQFDLFFRPEDIAEDGHLQLEAYKRLS